MTRTAAAEIVYMGEDTDAMFYNQARQLVRQWNGTDPSLCPSCTAPLIPKRGDMVAWHWAHHASAHWRVGCPYEESAWHLTWKQMYLTLGWQVEVPYQVGTQRFILDAMNPRTGRIREFVHTLSPHYYGKHVALQSTGLDLLWIFDGDVFRSARARGVKRGGMKGLLKPLPYSIAQHMNVLVHDSTWMGAGMQTLWREWKANIWFPLQGAQSRKLLQLYVTLTAQEARL